MKSGKVRDFSEKSKYWGRFFVWFDPKNKKTAGGIKTCGTRISIIFLFYQRVHSYIPRDFLNDSKLEQSATPAYSPLILSSMASIVSLLA